MGDDLSLQYADGTQVTLENYYVECKAGDCDVTVPGNTGEGYKINLNPRHIDVALDAVGSAFSVNQSEADPSVNSEATTPPTSSDGSGLGQHYRIVEDRNDVVGVSSASTVLAPNDTLVMVTSLLLAEPLSITTTPVTPPSGIPIVRRLAVGVVMAGPVISSNDLEVQLFEADNVTFLGVAVIDATGHFLMDIHGYLGVVVAKVVSNGNHADFIDEATGLAVNLDISLGAVGVADATGITLYVNPLTTIAALLSGWQSQGWKVAEPNESAVLQANATVAAAFGLTGSLTAPLNLAAVIDVDGQGNSSADQYGKVLAALSAMDEHHDGMAATIAYLSRDLEANSGTLSQEATANIIIASQDGSLTALTGGSLADDLAEMMNISTDKFAAVDENTLFGQVVYTAGPGTSHTLSGIDAARFSINSTTGAVALVVSPDYESKSTYEFAVSTATTTGLVTDNVVLVVNNLNDIAPIFTSGSTGSVPENSATSVVLRN